MSSTQVQIEAVITSHSKNSLVTQFSINYFIVTVPLEFFSAMNLILDFSPFAGERSAYPILKV